MLRIYRVSLVVVARVKALSDQVAVHDCDQARQLRRSVVSVALNIAEGAGVRGGHRRQRYMTALGSAEESRANLDIAAALGYIEPVDDELAGQFDHIIGTLVNLTR